MSSDKKLDCESEGTISNVTSCCGEDNMIVGEGKDGDISNGNCEDQPRLASSTANLHHIGDAGPHSPGEAPVAMEPREIISFKLVYKKTTFDINFDVNNTIAELKAHILTLTDVTPQMQKLMFRGLLKDNHKTLRFYNVVSGSKLMLIGSTMNDVISVVSSKPDASSSKDESSTVKKDLMCNQTQHKKVLDKYKRPDDCPVGIRNVQEPLPPVPLWGMLNKVGHKVRLTFKLELDQLWIGTKDRTQKVNMSSITTVVSQPIEGDEAYHILGLQMGTTEASCYWIYYFPAQYVESLRSTILG